MVVEVHRKCNIYYHAIVAFNLFYHHHHHHHHLGKENTFCSGIRYLFTYTIIFQLRLEPVCNYLKKRFRPTAFLL
jgi:hypothetical protein